MNNLTLSIVILTALFGVVSCTTSSQSSKNHDLVMCTAQYDPVCAREKIDGEIFFKTYSNSCSMSNAKGEILSSTDGACE